LNCTAYADAGESVQTTSPCLIANISTLAPILLTVKSTLFSPERDTASFSFGKNTFVAESNSSNPARFSDGP
jgi:hypothetical protein